MEGLNHLPVIQQPVKGRAVTNSTSLSIVLEFLVQLLSFLSYRRKKKDPHPTSASPTSRESLTIWFSTCFAQQTFDLQWEQWAPVLSSGGFSNTEGAQLPLWEALWWIVFADPWLSLYSLLLCPSSNVLGNIMSWWWYSRTCLCLIWWLVKLLLDMWLKECMNVMVAPTVTFHHVKMTSKCDDSGKVYLLMGKLVTITFLILMWLHGSWLIFSSPPPALLRYKWQLKFVYLRCTTCWFDITYTL